MNIDNKPGRRRCKNHKAPLLAEIKITRGEGLQGSFAHLEIERLGNVFFSWGEICFVESILCCVVKYIFEKEVK